jgi:CO dehydrogenase/acetyl-CoA synthase delta subunit
MIYMQKGDSVVEVKTGSRTATMGPRRYVAVGEKRLYYFEAPYELASA